MSRRRNNGNPFMTEDNNVGDEVEKNKNTLSWERRSGTRNEDEDDYRQQRSGQSDVYGTAEDRFKENMNDEATEVEYLKLKTKKVQQQSLLSTRNALRTIRESENVAIGTMSQLSKQSEQLRKADTDASKTKMHAKLAREETHELKKASRLFAFSMPKFFSRKKKKDIEASHKAEAEYNAKMMRCDELSQGASSKGYRWENDPRIARKLGKKPKIYQQRKATDQQHDSSKGDSVGDMNEGSDDQQRRHSNVRMTGDLYDDDDFSTDDDQEYGARPAIPTEIPDEHDAVEREIDQNLGEISSTLGLLKQLGLDMQTEIEGQNRRIDSISNNAVDANDVFRDNMRALNKF